MKFIAVSSLSHSGSTVLSMALSCHENLISLGEIFQVVREKPSFFLSDCNAKCSCGASAKDCEFWGPVLQEIQQTFGEDGRGAPYDNINEKYQIVLDRFNKVFGNESTAIDTSKGSRHFELIAKSETLNPNVIFLIRDVRSFALSQKKVAKGQKRKGLKKLKGVTWFQFLKWYFCNRKRIKSLQSNRIDTFKIGYEDFCFNTEKRLIEYCEKIGIDFDKRMATLENPKHHILYGNQMRLDKKKKQGIRYDAEWLSQLSFNLPAAVLPFVMRYNKQQVYGKAVNGAYPIHRK